MKFKDFDVLFLYCMNKKMKNIIRLYMIPYEEVVHRTGIGIYLDKRIESWYDQYRIWDIQSHNDVYHNLTIDEIVLY